MNGEPRVVLVTGASSGIGKATVERFLRDRAFVYAAARRLDRMRELEAAGAILLPLDLTDDTSITSAWDDIYRRHGRIDVLVNNAGYGSYGAVEDVPLEEARRQFEVNVFGLARLIQLVTPGMRERRMGKIINITSIGGKIWEPLGGWYHATKFAVEGLSDCLRLELRPFGIDVIVIEPGAIRTEWSSGAQQSLLATSGQTAYAEQARRAAKLLAMGENSAAEPEMVAATIAKAVRATRPGSRYVVGAGAKPLLAIRKLSPDCVMDSLMTSMLQYADRREFGHE